MRVDAAGQQLTIAIEDDGRGVDFARVAETAVREGVLSEAEAAQSSAHELTRILFRPGFSTAGSVTDLSGRGMGLSVVYEAVRRLHGEVEVLPREGAGTIVRFSVPLSISTHRVLLLGCGAQRFAIPVSGVEQLHRIKLKSVVTVEGGAAVMLDGQPVPLFTLSQLLGLDEGQPGQESLPVMVLGSKGRRTARRGGRVSWGDRRSYPRSGSCDAPERKNLGWNPARRWNDRPGAQPGGSSSIPSERVRAYAFAARRASRQPLTRSILVADDSLTTRTLEKSILEAYGYRVRVAVDGMEALAQLRAEKADLLITDVQMPRMDGFGLLEADKTRSSFEWIPVIIVTSLEHRDDQERGYGFGRRCVHCEAKFDQGELLATIRQIFMRKVRVLIVEDSRVVREYPRTYHWAGSSFRGSARLLKPPRKRCCVCRRVSPDVISMDIRLPGINGFEATQRIMTEMPTPIVVVSSSVESEDLKITMNALAAGALSVIEKPCGVESSEYEGMADRLCTQLAIMSQVRVVRRRIWLCAFPWPPGRRSSIGPREAIECWASSAQREVPPQWSKS